MAGEPQPLREPRVVNLTGRRQRIIEDVLENSNSGFGLGTQAEIAKAVDKISAMSRLRPGEDVVRELTRVAIQVAHDHVNDTNNNPRSSHVTNRLLNPREGLSVNRAAAEVLVAALRDHEQSDLAKRARTVVGGRLEPARSRVATQTPADPEAIPAAIDSYLNEQPAHPLANEEPNTRARIAEILQGAAVARNVEQSLRNPNLAEFVASALDTLANDPDGLDRARREGREARRREQSREHQARVAEGARAAGRNLNDWETVRDILGDEGNTKDDDAQRESRRRRTFESGDAIARSNRGPLGDLIPPRTPVTVRFTGRAPLDNPDEIDALRRELEPLLGHAERRLADPDLADDVARHIERWRNVARHELYELDTSDPDPIILNRAIARLGEVFAPTSRDLAALDQAAKNAGLNPDLADTLTSDLGQAAELAVATGEQGDVEAADTANQLAAKLDDLSNDLDALGIDPGPDLGHRLHALAKHSESGLTRTGSVISGATAVYLIAKAVLAIFGVHIP